MLQYEKVQVIQDAINHVLDCFFNKSDDINTKRIVLDKLTQWKVQTEALAEQEAIEMADEASAEETRRMKEWQFTNDALKNWEIKEQIMIPVGVPWACQEYTEDEFYKHEQIQK